MDIRLEDISIRTELEAGDLGRVIYLHGLLYKQEYGYGIAFESYVAGGLHDFYTNFDSGKDRVWVCEYEHELVGFLLLAHRENNSAQLRYFIIRPGFRGIGLGRKLMDLFMDFFNSKGYQSAYLWTVSELPVAAALYKRYGFQLKEEFPADSFGKHVIEQCYRLDKK